tara:strand:+ start:389 stop:574 length:186 start_codon:yes stop_codon:yes gene_type:complete
MPTYRLKKTVVSVYEMYVDADSDEQAEKIAYSDDQDNIRFECHWSLSDDETTEITYDNIDA